MTKSKAQQSLELVAILMLTFGGGVVGYNYYQEQQALSQKTAEEARMVQQATLPPPRGKPPMPIATDGEIEKPKFVELNGSFSALTMSASSPAVLLERNDGKPIWEVWDLQNLKLRSTLELPEPPNWIATEVSKDGKRPQIQLTSPRPMCLSVDGSRAAGMIGYPAEGRHALCIWSTVTGKLLRRDYDPDREVSGLQFIDNNVLLCMGKVENDYLFEKILIDEDRVEVVSTQNRAIDYSQQFLVRNDTIALLQNRKAVIISISSGAIRELNICQAEPAVENSGASTHSNAPIHLALSNDGSQLYCFQGSTCEIWNAAKSSRERRFTIGSDTTVSVEQPISDCYALAVPRSGFITTHHLATGEPVAAIGFPLLCECVGLSSNQQAMVLKETSSKKIFLVNWKRPLPSGKTLDLARWIEVQTPPPKT